MQAVVPQSGLGRNNSSRTRARVKIELSEVETDDDAEAQEVCSSSQLSQKLTFLAAEVMMKPLPGSCTDRYVRNATNFTISLKD